MMSSSVSFPLNAHHHSSRSFAILCSSNLRFPSRPADQSTQFIFLRKSPTPPIKIQSFPPQPLLPKLPSASTSRSNANPAPVVPLLVSCGRKLALLALGSVLSIASFRYRPAMAENISKTAPLEEKMESKKESNEEESGFIKILERDPENIEALKMVVYGKMRKGDMGEAMKYIERLTEMEPDELEWRLLQALSYEMMGQLAKAKRLFKDILKRRPLLVRALHGLALVMHRNREGPAVFHMLNKALELAVREQRVTEERDIKILIAQMHVVMGDLEGGLEKFKKLASENPRDFRPFLCQGIIYSLMDKKQEAEKQFEIYQALAPKEFPQRGFLDDVVLSAKTASREKLQEEFNTEFSEYGV